jgi:hypothetical protein
MFIENPQLNVINQSEKRKILTSSLSLELIGIYSGYFKSVL